MTRKLHLYFNSTMDSAEEWHEALASEFDDFVFSTGEEVADPGSVDVAIIWTMPTAGLTRFSNLRAILSLGAGINQFDPRLLPPGVPLARLVDGMLTRMMVDYAKTAVFRFHRRFHLFEARTRSRDWIYLVPTLTETTTVGVLGLGELGSEIALALSRENFVVLGHSRTPKNLPGVTTFTSADGLAEMAGRCDILINVLPLTDATRHIWSKSFFANCRKGVCLINMGRGPHVLESDLLDALNSGQVQAAVLDVSTVEPLPDAHPFWNHPGILLTPHVAGTSVPKISVKTIAANVRRAMAGERLAQQVDPDRGY